MDHAPIIIWFRRDLRMSDHPALAAACREGRAVIPVFIRDPLTDGIGAAARWRLELGLGVFAQQLRSRGSRLILRSGDALKVLNSLIRETGAETVWWSRLYDPHSIARDSVIRTELTRDGIAARSFAGHLLFEPWTVSTRAGGFFRVYTPMWRSVRDRPVAACEDAPARLPAPERWPDSENLADWNMGRAMQRGARVVCAHVAPGESAALARLDGFIQGPLARYRTDRDRPDLAATSGLSEYLALGEIGPRVIWHAGHRAMAEGLPGAEQFLKELVWREFAYHLMYHSPDILTANWKPGWDGFPWNTDPERADVVAWKQGRTGVAFVDAAMRELYVTGRMHNRARMIVASYLTKHLLSHWKIGLDWFGECLVDWDPASNAMGWQWVAGSGPDAAPYFRIFNPQTQQQKFDPDGVYVRRWIAEGQDDPPDSALSFFRAVPRAWNLGPHDPYPEPSVSLADGRRRALEAYEQREF